MEIGGAEQWRAANDALATAEVVGVSQRDEITALWRERARLDAQLARRVAEFDTSVGAAVAGRARGRSRSRRIELEEEPEEGCGARTTARELLPHPQRHRDPRWHLRYRRRRDHRHRAATLLRTQPPGG